MARQINPIPKGYRSATTALVVRNAAAAIDYYIDIFGAEEISRLYAADGITILRAEIKIGNSLLHLNDEIPAAGILSPISLGGTTGSVQLYLEDLDNVWDRATNAGSTVIFPLENTYWGERSGRIVDAFGHVWNLSKRIESVSKAEIEKRAAALFAPVIDPADEGDILTVEIRDLESQIAEGATEH